MNLTNALAKREYTVSAVKTDDEELNSFLFSLGCYSGEKIAVTKHNRSGCIVLIKDAKYSIDIPLAKAILIE